MLYLNVILIFTDAVRSNYYTKQATESDIIITVKKWLVRSKEQMNSAAKQRYDRYLYDKRRVLELITKVNAPVTAIVQCYRLGKVSESRNRPIRVILTSSSIAHYVVTKYKPQKSIYINKDLTKMQQNRAYLIRQEFKSKLENGETNIQLKYVNGVPKIVVKKN